MAYTVQQLAELSGVTVRALHHYHEIGLLFPAYTGENGYRYYEKEQVLLLQQILFFRELGIGLQEIGRILERSDFNKINALERHRKQLEREIERKNELIRTITRTVRNLKGEEEMEAREYYYGFDSERQKEYEKEVVEMYGQTAEKLISEARNKKWSVNQWEALKGEFESLNKRLSQQIERGLKPSDPAVQEEIAIHLSLIKQCYTPTKEVYLGLGKLYSDHPGFVKFYERYHPDLASFLREAIEVFVETRWDK